MGLESILGAGLVVGWPFSTFVDCRAFWTVNMGAINMNEQEMAYTLLKAKVINLGGKVTQPTKAGNFSVSLKGCRYLLTQHELATACFRLPFMFGEVLVGKRGGKRNE